MRQKELRKENMIVLIWPIFIPVNMLADIPQRYFDRMYSKLESSTVRRGRFCNDNSRSLYYPRGYTYGEDSEGEFPDNSNLFDLRRWRRYSPFNTCASAQMLIKKEAGI